MTGKELHKKVKSSKIAVTTLIERTGIVRGTFFSLYHKPEVEEYYIELIQAAGVDLGLKSENLTDNKINIENTIEVDKKYHIIVKEKDDKIKWLEDKIQMQQQIIDLLRGQNNLLNKKKLPDNNPSKITKH